MGRDSAVGGRESPGVRTPVPTSPDQVAKLETLQLEIERAKREIAAHETHLERAHYGDLAVVSCLLAGGLIAAIWLMGTSEADGPYSAAMLVGGLVGSASGALVYAARPYRPYVCGVTLWRAVAVAVGALGGPVAAAAVYQLLTWSVLESALPAAPHDRLLIGFAAGAAMWRLMQPLCMTTMPQPAFPSHGLR